MVKKIMIVSDSHGRSQNIKTAIDRESPDMLIHLGDIEDDPESIRSSLDKAARKSGKKSLPIPAVFIQGNCDRYGYTDVLKKTAVFELNGHKFFCTHGHVQGVSYGIENLMYTAMENGCDIALYGHTHVPFDENFEGFETSGESLNESDNSQKISVRIMNPGSISLPRGGKRKSYMIMTFDDNNDYMVELKYL
ncbi:hypothetical protein SAMN06297422_10157 [Lachnospiraceae bacterium]|nr:hypothetical protein SAMN06297422_10157 [Lachnospiraceae bacterium]